MRTLIAGSLAFDELLLLRPFLGKGRWAEISTLFERTCRERDELLTGLQLLELLRRILEIYFELRHSVRRAE